jgi:hypothetical protein
MWNINKSNINTYIKKRNNTFKSKKTTTKHTFFTFKFMLKIRITKKKVHNKLKTNYLNIKVMKLP